MLDKYRLLYAKSWIKGELYFSSFQLIRSHREREREGEIQSKSSSSKSTENTIQFNSTWFGMKHTKQDYDKNSQVCTK